MKAVMLDRFGAAPEVRDDLPAPIPGAGELLVRVHASSVNPVDNAIAAGMMKDMIPHEFPITLGRDYAGVVEEIGADVTGFAVGDKVFGTVGLMPAVHDGSWAEMIVVAEDGTVARTPEGLDLAVAGAAPVAAVTGMLAFDALDVGAGDTVVIIGATGGVGSVAAQLASAAGATVIAPALAEDEEYLRGLGVTEIVPREGDVVAAVRERHPTGVDALLDNVSYTPGTFDDVLGEGARVVSPLNAAGEGPRRVNVIGLATPENLQRLGALLASGALELPIQQTYVLDDAPAALNALATTHVRGKRSLRLS